MWCGGLGIQLAEGTWLVGASGCGFLERLQDDQRLLLLSPSYGDTRMEMK